METNTQKSFKLSVHEIKDIVVKHLMKHIKLFEEYSLAEGKITLSWNDDENSIVFSDGEIAQVDYDGEFKYRDEWFSTVDHTDAKDLIKDLQKRFKGDRFVWMVESN